jgi:hypothetical protein
MYTVSRYGTGNGLVQAVEQSTGVAGCKFRRSGGKNRKCGLRFRTNMRLKFHIQCTNFDTYVILIKLIESRLPMIVEDQNCFDHSVRENQHVIQYGRYCTASDIYGK